MLKRRAIKRSLAEWARHKGFEPAPHHLLIINSIEQFLDSDEQVLLLFAPPGSAKSTYVSILLPSWYLANHPTASVLFATHNEDFAKRWGRRVRADITNEGKILGLELSVENQAADRWGLVNGGEYYGVGAGTGISGIRADIGIGDDFFGSRDDAYSPAIRQTRWEWYISDFSARCKPGAKRILISTRWHEDDVVGRILKQIEKGIVRGRVINIRAEAEDDDPLGRKPGELLWDDPQGYNYGQFLRDRKLEESPMMWSALYQQHPSPEKGDYFKSEWLIPYETRPSNDTMQIYGASDYATKTDAGDYTVHIVVGLDPDNRMYLLDLWRGQAAPDVWIDVLCDLVLRWKPIEWGEESGQIASGVGPFIKRRQIERDAYVYRRQFPQKYDKGVRAQSIRGRMALSGLYVPANAPWFPAFRTELMHFPGPGQHDDQADALGLVGQLLDHMSQGTLPKDKPAQKPTELIFTALPDGKLVANMSIFDVVMAKQKKREALRL